MVSCNVVKVINTLFHLTYSCRKNFAVYKSGWKPLQIYKINNCSKIPTKINTRTPLISCNEFNITVLFPKLFNWLHKPANALSLICRLPSMNFALFHRTSTACFIKYWQIRTKQQIMQDRGLDSVWNYRLSRCSARFSSFEALLWTWLRFCIEHKIIIVNDEWE